MSATNNVQVKYRQVELASEAPLGERADGTLHLGLPSPPPVRTVLSIVSSKDTRAYVVVSVIETAAEGSTRGCVLREVPLDQIPVTVGTEAMRTGALGSAEATAAAPGPADGDSGADDDAEGYGAHMAVPAPVISEDISEPHELGDEGNHDEAATPEGGDEAAAPEAGNGDGGAASRGKKRRGRQRK